jgi:hypothetical protein
MAAKHPNKHIREAIGYALQQGWTFHKSNGRAHAFGRLYCPFPAGCQFSVYSTPRDPEEHARWIRRQVDRCPHHPPAADHDEPDDDQIPNPEEQE